MKPTDTVVPGTHAGRAREWISVTTVAVPTVWLATADGLVLLDLLAIELTVNGCRTGDWMLTGPEAAYAADVLLRLRTDRMRIAQLIGRDYRTLRNWFPTDDTPLAEALPRIGKRSALQIEAESARPAAPCGSYYGAQRHKRRKEPLCGPCRWAKNAANRHYRRHGTYVGAPEYTGAAS
ncbi:hypothetical protein UK15_07895 [Streptomyces variegatus]|uniref:Uncharacterized protein n=1 Tax=Streptomyces variegatus TaxID=284040 RepID=A0A0M2GQ61_9ACTN|nr:MULTISPECIES: hypothetical protein [Streptomyces]KJK40261.1 hypothetical protein UK15_07895 [Streptomyces variegatus]